MIKTIKTSLIALLLTYSNAHALDYAISNWIFKLDADGMIGFFEPRDEKAVIIDDWDVKTQISYKFNNTQRIGAVYSLDADCVEDDEYIHDAFILLEDRDIGRTEFGLTHSIARKMGLGLPDVGYLRINDKSILYKELKLKRVLISDTAATTGHEAPRLNLATTVTDYGQYGLSISGLSDDYNYAIDFAVKFKDSVGKVKTAYSLALSFMDKPEDYVENSFSPETTADWRTQMALGFNLQYNSFIWGTSARLIYDHNPIHKTSDGLIAGTGVSYDLLQTSVSLSYLYSNTNMWKHHDYNGIKIESGDYLHTILASFRYKYSEETSLFMSAGLADTTPFFSVGLHSGF